MTIDRDRRDGRGAKETLDRFVSAQAEAWPRALAELRRGAKTSHWMWFVFPQIAGLGRSATAIHYAIRDRDEARAYLAHPLLGPRLIEASAAMLAQAGRSADAVLGGIDAIKLRSSMTLFEAAGFEATGGDAVFGEVIDAFFAGRRDEATLALLPDPPAD